MDYYKIPLGFGMALSMEPNALNAYSAMTDEQKQAVLARAHRALNDKTFHNRIESKLHNLVTL